MAEAGKVASSQDGTWIPATKRADGSWRKARRVKEGYVPPDEVDKYESKGKQWVSSIPKLPPGVYEDDNKSETKSKNQKKRRNKKKDGNSNVSEITETLAQTRIQPGVAPTKTFTTMSNPDELKHKRLKNLKKKLKQIEELQSKIDSGEIAKPELTQLEKLKKKNETEKEIEELETSLGT